MLEDIQSKDIKNLSMDQLRALANEIRHRLIEVCAKNGGHLAPNLGIVEITLALHYVYDFPMISWYGMLGIKPMYINY